MREPVITKQMLIDAKAFREAADLIEAQAAEIERLRSERDCVVDTLDAWFDRRKLAHEEIDAAVLDATKRYLGVSRIGGMDSEESDLVECVVENMARLSVFADLFARAKLEAANDIESDAHHGAKQMSKPVITKQMLIDAKACRDQVDLFEKTFGDSVVVTVKRAEKVANLFNWDWAARFLDATALGKYQRFIAPASAECRRVTQLASAEYQRVIKTASAKRRRVIETASAEDERAIETASAKYLRVIETAFGEYKRITAPASAECRRVTAIAWASAFVDMHKRGASK